MDFDVVVVGAGVAGCTVAKLVSDEGYSVALVDRKSKDKIGDKVCGDGVSNEGFDLLEKVFGNLKNTTDNKIKNAILCFPDNSEIVTNGEGFILDRHKMGQAILNKCLKNNVKLFHKHFPSNLKTNKLIIKKSTENKTIPLKSKIIVDASGFSCVLGRSLNPRKIKRNLSAREFGIAFREIKRLDEPIDSKNRVYFYFDEKRIPIGYGWIFPKGSKKANIGIGVQNTTGKNPKKIYDSFFQLKGKALDSSGGIMPLRRGLHNLVDDNFLIVGDAACQCSPLHGGGIETSALGSELATQVIVEALEKKKYDKSFLWNYNLKYHNTCGRMSAKEEAVKAIGGTLPSDILKTMISKIDTKNLQLISKDTLSLINKPRALKTIIIAQKHLGKINGLYDSYPKTPGGFSAWDRKANLLFNQIYKVSV